LHGLLQVERSLRDCHWALLQVYLGIVSVLLNLDVTVYRLELAQGGAQFGLRWSGRRVLQSILL